MTRKRFVKLVMALGNSRNRANALAYACRVAGVPYEKYYRHNSLWWRPGEAGDQASASALNTTKVFNCLAAGGGKNDPQEIY